MKNRLLALALFLIVSPAFAQAPPPPKVQARLVAEDVTVPPGGTVAVALEEKIAPGWHTYWSNPGAAGEPTEIKWSLPPGWRAGAIQWPHPTRLPVGPLMNYGYENKVWLLTKLTVPADAKAGDVVTLKAAVDWLVCKDVCIPEDATVSLPLMIGAAAPDPSAAQGFAAARAEMPVASPWKTSFALGKTLDLFIAAPQLAAAHPASAQFFPAHSATILDAADQAVGYASSGLVLRLAPDPKFSGMALDGVLVLTSSDGSVQSITIGASKGPVPPADFPATGGGAALLTAILFAFLGGIILNVMPCVLPILAMKALALSSGHGARESLAYAAGAVLSFLLFGLAIILLRQGGAAVGWGFQLQSPLAVGGFALLIFAVGLNLSGLFEVGSITAGEGLAHRSGLMGAFFTGVLAVAVASPCTAPFMAAALGVALTLPVVSALCIFLALGIGFALPFLIFGMWPRARALMPRPGVWMLKLKQFLAFPMYAAAAWLVWVLAQEAGPQGVAVALAAMVAVALAAWTWSATRDLQARGRAVGLAAALVITAGALYGLSLLGSAAAPQAPARATADAYSPARLAELRAGKQPVFLDATAAWCITCLVNEQGVLSSAAVKQAFADHHVTYLVADWTHYDAAITALLKDNGRSGVPLYLYYAPGAASPVVLPQVLTQGTVLGALGH